MKILILNKYDNKGGAAIAAQRLAKSLLKAGEEVTMLVEEKTTELDFIQGIRKSNFSKKIGQYKFLFEKVLFMPYEVSKKERFSFSTALLGNKINTHSLVQSADVLHIHWTNHSFLSMKDIDELNKLGKPIVITMHDMWYATGGCHYTRDCVNFKNGCGDCMLLKKPKKGDISAKQFNKKRTTYSSNITFVGCSNWIINLAKESPLLANSRGINIPNPIDIDAFKPIDKIEAKKQLGIDPSKKHILFVAASLNDERKGLTYLKQALLLKDSKIDANTELLVLGNDKTNELTFSVPTVKLGYVSDSKKIALIYNAADVFVTPSLEDNLPNTIMESMACGTPCVAFRIGGIPDLIDHNENGYLANYKDVEDLNEGIIQVLQHAEYKNNAREKVLVKFSEKVVAAQFIELYNSIT